MIVVAIYVFIIIIFALIKKVNAYEAFTNGVTDSFKTVINLFPNLLFLILGINIFINSGIIEILEDLLANTFFIPELLIQAILRPTSSSSSLILMTKIFEKYGVDSIVGRVSSILQGSSDTTIYVIMIYFSSIKMTKIGNSLKIGLLTDLVTFVFVFLIFYILTLIE